VARKVKCVRQMSRAVMPHACVETGFAQPLVVPGVLWWRRARTGNLFQRVQWPQERPLVGVVAIRSQDVRPG